MGCNRRVFSFCSSLVFIRVVLVKKMVQNSEVEVLVDLLDTDFRPISWSIPYDGSPLAHDKSGSFLNPFPALFPAHFFIDLVTFDNIIQ